MRNLTIGTFTNVYFGKYPEKSRSKAFLDKNDWNERITFGGFLISFPCKLVVCGGTDLVLAVSVELLQDSS